MIYKRSSQLFEEAKIVIPGGVNSPVRAFKSVGGTPIFIKKAKGAYLFDEDDNKYIDYISSWGPMILGHAKKEIIEKIVSQAEKGTSYGIPTELESELASLIVSNIKNLISIIIFYCRLYTKNDIVNKSKISKHISIIKHIYIFVFRY